VYSVELVKVKSKLFAQQLYKTRIHADFLQILGVNPGLGKTGLALCRVIENH
jgi:hypothetical protein